MSEPNFTVTSLPDAAPRPRKVAIGTFDGVHLGHRQVIEGANTVLTFEPHPVQVIHPASAPKLIMPFVVKRDVIRGLGVEELVVIPFDTDFSHKTAEQFIEEVLIEKLNATSVSVRSAAGLSPSSRCRSRAWRSRTSSSGGSNTR